MHFEFWPNQYGKPQRTIPAKYRTREAVGRDFQLSHVRGGVRRGYLGVRGKPRPFTGRAIGHRFSFFFDRRKGLAAHLNHTITSGREESSNPIRTTEPINMEIQNEAQRELPRYKCHKEVWALKIKGIINAPPTLPKNWAALEVEDEGYMPVTVDDQYMAKHKPEAGGYYVVYADGYKSFSPAKAFEDGYSKIA